MNKNLLKNNSVKPLLKWAGGKRQLLDIILKNFPPKFNKFIEPFVGGGALFFYLNKRNSIISDTNEELINLYNQVAKNPRSIIRNIKKFKNTKNFFYKTRKKNPNNNILKASRIIYLNRTCFNGLYRVNRKGEFNVPYGNYKNVSFVDKQNLAKASKLLKQTKILNEDYKKILIKYAKKGDLIFLDPPYFPISKYSDFKRYTKEQFYLKDHINLAKLFSELDKKGCYLILTNSKNKEILKLYNNYNIQIFDTQRIINKIGSKRTGKDILVKNFL